LVASCGRMKTWLVSRPFSLAKVQVHTGQGEAVYLVFAIVFQSSVGGCFFVVLATYM